MTAKVIDMAEFRQRKKDEASGELIKIKIRGYPENYPRDLIIKEPTSVPRDSEDDPE
jgi:hypothetical protein